MKIKTIIYLLIISQLFIYADDLKKTVIPKRISDNISLKVDGILNEKIWAFKQNGFESEKNRLGNFIQYSPRKGNKSVFPTEIRILYSKTHIYFGIFCFDDEPEKISATLTKRDGSMTTDDSIGIKLDTFFDQRSAYYFFINPLATQSDGRLTDDGRTSDSTWDEKWVSEARIVKNGWTAEIAIPFSAIKYIPGKKRQWGLGVLRTIPRKLEKSTWTGPVEQTDKVSQFGILNELELNRSKSKVQIIPHIIAKYERSADTQLSAGIDARYAISQSVSANLTVNPDFAIIESDQEKINLSRFEQSLSEKRHFFLEGAENYRQRIKLFYSRRIRDIYGAVKVYGKSGKYEYSAMTVQSKPEDDLNIDGANFTVLRLKRNIFKSSSIGFLLSNKLSNKRNYGSMGLDLVHFFSKKINMTAQLAMSYGEYNNENFAFFLRPSYDSSDFHIHLRYTQLGENFADNANHSGFISDDNRNELDSAIEKIWWINKYGIDRLNYESNYNIYWSKKGDLRSWAVFQGISIDLSNRFSVELEYEKEYKLYEKDFYNNSLELNLGYNKREWQSLELKYEFGKSFDLDYQIIGVELNYKLFKNISLEYELDRLILDPDPEKESTWIHVFRLTNYFNKDLYLKLFYQTNSSITKNSIQALFVYRFQPPFGTVQLAYQRGNSERGLSSDQNDTVFVKFSYVF